MINAQILKEYHIKAAQIKAEKLTAEQSMDLINMGNSGEKVMRSAYVQGKMQIASDKRTEKAEDRNKKLRQLLSLKNGRHYICFYNRIVECALAHNGRKAHCVFPLDLGLETFEKHTSVIEGIKYLLKYNLINWNDDMTAIFVI